MKILHLPSSYFPTVTGGKEVFVQQLIRHATRHEHRVLYHDGETSRQYVFEGAKVHVLPMPETKDNRKSYFSLVYEESPGFVEILESYKPDIVHFHDESVGASLTHLRACRSRNIKTVLTYHSPGQSCAQGSLMYGGKKPSDGRVSVTHCTACRYEAAGLPAVAAQIAARIDLPFDRSGKFLKRHSTALYINGRKEFFSTVDSIQVHASWVYDHLIANDVKPEKITGITLGGHASLPAAGIVHHNTGKIRFVFVGRCIDIKGVHILVDAIKMLPDDAPVDVYFFGPYWSDTDYGRHLQQRVANDPRFKAPELIAPDDVIKRLSEMDVCVIPSLWPETGPFTVFDAFAARLPVIGTDFAGIAERVHHNVNGLLFPWNDTKELFTQISYIVNNREVVERLRKGIVSNHTFAEMGEEISQKYEQLLS